MGGNAGLPTPPAAAAFEANAFCKYEVILLFFLSPCHVVVSCFMMVDIMLDSRYRYVLRMSRWKKRKILRKIKESKLIGNDVNEFSILKFWGCNGVFRSIILQALCPRDDA